MSSLPLLLHRKSRVVLDALAYPDGALPAGKWIAPAGVITSKALAITPTFGANLIADNADFETGSPPTNWTAYNGTPTSEADQRPGGTGSQCLQVVATSAAGGVRRAITSSVGKFLRFSQWAKFVSGATSTDGHVCKLTGTDFMGTGQMTTNTSWTNLVVSGRVTFASLYVYLVTYISVGATAKYDDVAVNELTWNTQFAFIRKPFPYSNPLVSLRVTNPLNTAFQFNHWAGLAINWDSPTNPQNGLLAVLWTSTSPSGLYCSLFQITGGTTLTTLIQGTALTSSSYTDTASIVVRLQAGGAVSLYYAGVLQGTATVTDGTTLAGKYNGIFTSNDAPTFTNFYCRPETAVKNLTFIGDSISANTHSWTNLVPGNKMTTPYVAINHAVGGATILNDTVHSYLDAQVAAAASDNADVIVIELGTNETSVDTNALTTDILSAITTLRSTNPHAVIYWLNVLPRWTGYPSWNPVDRSYIQGVIAAACATAGVPCWDTSSVPWITTTDVDTGQLHPNASGNRKIADQILLRIP